jgi:hypothetical protein
MTEYTCDRCPTEVPDGAGIYIGDARVCAECAEQPTSVYTIVAYTTDKVRYFSFRAESLSDAIRQAETMTAVNIRSRFRDADAWRGHVNLLDEWGYSLATISEPVAPYRP